MTDKTEELLEAAKGVLPLLTASTDHYEALKAAEEKGQGATLDYLISRKPVRNETPAEKLRREADELEAKDASIHRFRAAVAAFE